MRDILSKQGVEVLAALARTSVLLAFDFDGTLAPTVADRDQAEMRARTRALFREVCRVYPCAVISGRGRSDVRRRLGDAEVIDVVGNHGLESSRDLGPFERQMATVRAQLEKALPVSDGIEIEDKHYSVSLHYRRAVNKTMARRRIRSVVKRIASPMRIIPGKLVVNVVPASAPNKGDALLELKRHAGTAKTLYVGDDITDEDVFALDRSDEVVSIRIGRSATSAASFYLNGQGKMDALLAQLCDLRARALKS